jgi:hypothetical protein
MFRLTGKAVSPSEGELVDCAYSDGCEGGFESDAYYYISYGIQNEYDYPVLIKENFPFNQINKELSLFIITV